MRSCVERRLPALSSFLGHKPAQEMRCADVWNRDMSTPSSDTIRARLRRAGQRIRLAIRRGDATRTVELALRALI